ncbi:MAG: hypothetical protein LUF92_18025 [Clostridiales bacterium]|nr:hypothetical protein [Clostridiales bacterium]
MAMFFLISGYGFYCRSTKKCISVQYRLLFKPYCFTACAVLVTKLILSVVRWRPFMEHGGEYVLTFLLGLNAEGGGELFGIPVKSVGIFWFVLSLMNGWIIYNAICQLKNKRVQWILVIACVVSGYVLTRISHIWVYCLHTSLMAVGYLAVGSRIREYDLLERSLPWWLYVLLLIPVGISCVWGNVNMITGYWKLGLFDMLSTYCLGFLLMRFFAIISTHSNNGIVIRFFETIGFNSIWILCIHLYEKVIFPWYHLTEIFQGYPVIGTVIYIILRSFLIFIIFEFVRWLDRLRKQRKRNSRGKIVLEE